MFKIDNSFLDDVKNISNSKQFREIVDNYYTLPSTVTINCSESRIYQTHSCPDSDLNELSFSASFSLLNLCTFSIPESLTFTNFDALFQFNPYYTDGNVKTRGKDSISYTPVGGKLFIICNRVKQSVLLERQLKSVKNFIQFVKNCPGKSDINAISRAQETLSNYGNGLQNNAFKSLINIHGIKGAAEWSSFRDNQLGRVSGITEHLQS